MVYVPFGGMAGDCGEYKGAVVGVPADGSGEAISYVVPTERMGGIWNPTGIPVDADGDLWVATGNTASSVNLRLRQRRDQDVAPARGAGLLRPEQLGEPSTRTTWTSTPLLRCCSERKSADNRQGQRAYLLDAAKLGEIGGEITYESRGLLSFRYCDIPGVKGVRALRRGLGGDGRSR